MIRSLFLTSRTFLQLCALVLPVFGVSCATVSAADAPRASAVAVLEPTEGNTVRGVLRFVQTPNGVRITGLISNLTPGEHGFHVHEFGDLTSRDGSAAGGHFNPENRSHGGPESDHRHVGDLGNITADKEGNAVVNVLDPALALSGSRSIIGRSIVVHAQPDDLSSQPSGNAGARVAVGVIGLSRSNP